MEELIVAMIILIVLFGNNPPEKEKEEYIERCAKYRIRYIPRKFRNSRY